MPTETMTVCQTFWTPADNPLGDFAYFLASAKTIYRAIVYGVTLQPWYDAIAAMDDRGVDIRIILDSSQEAGPAAKPKLAALLAARPHLAGRIVQGRSEKNAIIHLKGQMVNYVEGAEPPEAYYGHWREAADAGYPVTWTGSWNFSDGASNQNNNADIMPGIMRARGFQHAFDSLWAVQVARQLAPISGEPPGA